MASKTDYDNIKSASKSSSASRDAATKSEQKSVSESSGEGGGSGPIYVPQQPAPAPTPTGPTPEELLRQQQDQYWNQALERARNYGGQQVTNNALNQGLIDQYGVLDAFLQSVNDRAAAIDPYSNANPSLDSYLAQFGLNDYWNDALTAGQGRYRGDLMSQLNAVAPEGFESLWFGDTADDAVLQSILDLQKGDAQLTLDRAKARGQLNSQGYNRAQTELGNQYSAGMGTLQQLGSGVLAGYRDRLGNLRSDAMTRIGGATFGQPYNVGSVVDQLNSLKTSLTGGLQDDIMRTVGGQNFFDTGTAIGRGGATQGTTNPSRINFGENPLLASFAGETGRRTYGNNTGSTASTGTF